MKSPGRSGAIHKQLIRIDLRRRFRKRSHPHDVLTLYNYFFFCFVWLCFCVFCVFLIDCLVCAAVVLFLVVAVVVCVFVFVSFCCECFCSRVAQLWHVLVHLFGDLATRLPPGCGWCSSSFHSPPQAGHSVDLIPGVCHSKAKGLGCLSGVGSHSLRGSDSRQNIPTWRAHNTHQHVVYYKLVPQEGELCG